MPVSGDHGGSDAVVAGQAHDSLEQGGCNLIERQAA
jgi:hypothetical protein